MLSPEQLTARDGKLTASRIACLMTGDEAKIMNLWRDLIGDPAFVDDDLSDVWPVQLGVATEALNLEWFERKHGPVTRMGEVVAHPNGWAAATLDGWSSLHSAPVECKHVGGHETFETVRERYQPQMHWQMIVTNAQRCAFSVIMGASEPFVEFIDLDEGYAAELMQRAERFMECVRTLTPPIAQAPVAAPVKPEKTYDMAGSNSWAANAVTWLTTKQAAKDCAAAEKELKTLVAADAMRCHGAGIEIKRDRAGRLSVRESK